MSRRAAFRHEGSMKYIQYFQYNTYFLLICRKYSAIWREDSVSGWCQHAHGTVPHVTCPTARSRTAMVRTAFLPPYFRQKCRKYEKLFLTACRMGQTRRFPFPWEFCGSMETGTPRRALRRQRGEWILSVRYTPVLTALCCGLGRRLLPGIVLAQRKEEGVEARIFCQLGMEGCGQKASLPDG